MNKNKIINLINEYMPLETQENWDNSGWQIKLKNEEINNVLLTTTVNKYTLNQAIEKNVDLIISHHPLIFSPLKCIKDEIIIDAIKNDIQIYSIHTPFDKMENGTTENLAKFLGYENLTVINDYVRLCVLEQGINIDSVIQNIKEKFNVSSVKTVNYKAGKVINKIAFCAGSGGSFIPELKDTDLYITSDLKYHDVQDEENIVIIDVGHLESEKISLPTLKNILDKTGINIEIAEEKSNIAYI